LSQSQRFREAAARTTGCDEDEAAFEKRLKEDREGHDADARNEEAPPDEAGLVSLGNATRTMRARPLALSRFNLAELRAKKKPQRRGDSGLLRVPYGGNLMNDGGGKNPITVKRHSTSEVEGNPSENELFVMK